MDRILALGSSTDRRPGMGGGRSMFSWVGSREEGGGRLGAYLVDDVLVHVQIVVLLVDKVEVVVVLVVVIVVEVVCNICHCAGDKNSCSLFSSDNVWNLC